MNHCQMGGNMDVYKNIKIRNYDMFKKKTV